MARTMGVFGAIWGWRFFRKDNRMFLVVNWTSLSLMSEGGAEKGWPRYASEAIKSIGFCHLKSIALPVSRKQELPNPCFLEASQVRFCLEKAIIFSERSVP